MSKTPTSTTSSTTVGSAETLTRATVPDGYATGPVRRGMRAAKLFAVGTTLAAVSLAGCTSHHQQTAADGTNGPGSVSSASPNTKAAAGLPAGVTNASDVPTKVPNVPSLRHNVVLNLCSKTDTGWAAGGTANNPGTADKTYAITIFFATSGGTVIGTSHADVAVPAGGTKQWKAEQSFHAAAGTQCVLRGVA